MGLKQFSRAGTSILVVTAGLIMAVALSGGMLAANLRSDAIGNGKEQAERFVTGAQTAVNRSFLGIDVLLFGLHKLLELENAQAKDLKNPEVLTLMEGATRQNMMVHHVWLLSADGEVLTGSDRTAPGMPGSFAQQTLAQAAPALNVSQPVMSPHSAEEVLFFARPLPLGDGAAVLAVAEVPVSLITAILVQGADISQLEVTLERGNGQLLASVPHKNSIAGVRLVPALGGRASQVADEMPSRFGQRPALVASRPMLYDNLLFTVSIPMETVLEEWRFQLLLIGAVGLTFCLFLAAVGFVSVRYLQSMADAQRTITHAMATTDRALEAMENGFLLLDAEYKVVSWNRRYLEIYPWLDTHVAVGVPFVSLMGVAAHHHLPEASDEERAHWVADRIALLSESVHSHERQFPDGRIIETTERSTPDGGVVIVYQDVTRLRRASAEIEQLAFYDPLTGLPNRRLLTDRLQQAVVSTLRNGRHGALLFMDLDHFKTLNDTLGHDVGDLLLQQVAQRLKGCVREADTVARLGGDEFVVMLMDLSEDTAEAARQTRTVGDNLLRAVTLPYELNSKHYRSSCSLGAAMFGDASQQASDLLKQADIAMYQVKSSGRNALCFFDPGMLAAIEARAALETDLRRGLAEYQFALHYQIQMRDGSTPVGAEALIRWNHPERGMIAPGSFISLAEETGLIQPLGQWVIEEACRQLAQWQLSPATAGLELSVNVSARQFRDADFVDQVRSAIAQCQAPAQRLKLELTESLVLDNVDDTIAKMHTLKDLGVSFSMDDFGTGHSSLSYLTRLPLDQLKIDQSFVRNIGLQVTDSMIIQTIIGMGNNLGIEVLAEGVETEEQRAFLAEHGCKLCQGYLFGRPMPVEAFNATLREEVPA
ncbi:EAL domain-containing protein [Rhodoferax sp. OV413]|uniref:bifunctional diguanylate cyclase/phosphodiesterase n=1 Tax=Rhodoferax sp. OV413 TaxID=1855285 RepID=UPI0025E9C747|nr:EAL domain-containing protein [Rhodoferax sp. OV413]